MVSPAGYEAAATVAGRRPPVPMSTMAGLYGRYEHEKATRHLVDFDDLLVLCAAALEDDRTFGAAQRWRFRHLFVDEFQDVNPLQFRLLEAWRGDRSDLCVVGDPNQAIYAWNGADPSYLTGFRTRFPAAAVVHLDDNYRSSAADPGRGQRRPRQLRHRHRRRARPPPAHGPPGRRAGADRPGLSHRPGGGGRGGPGPPPPGRHLAVVADGGAHPHPRPAPPLRGGPPGGPGPLPAPGPGCLPRTARDPLRPLRAAPPPGRHPAGCRPARPAGDGRGGRPRRAPGGQGR